MKRWITGCAALLLLCAFFIWWHSPEQVVKRRVGKLLRLMSFEEGQGKAARLTGVYALHALLAREVELSTDSRPQVNGVMDREQIESGFNWLAGELRMSSITLRDFDSLRINSPFAEVGITVDATLAFRNSATTDGRFTVFMVWENQENQWLLNHVRWESTGTQ